jgi:hypothetical protein
VINNHACITITCNVCGDRLVDIYAGCTLHFDDLVEAVEAVETQDEWLGEHDWLIRPDGYALCPDDDRSHAAVRESFTTQPPAPQIPGQTRLVTETGA